MLSTPDTRIDGLFQEIIVKDGYKLLDLQQRNVDVILDIGANVGMFSVYARMLFPTAHITAIEPNPDVFEVLKQNTNHLNINCHNVALGDGKPVKLKNHLHSTCRATVTDESSPIPSLPLIDIIKNLKVPMTAGVLIKCDVEGAERWLLENKDAEKILHSTLAWRIEFHGAPLAIDKLTCKDMGYAITDGPTLLDYQAWIDKLRKENPWRNYIWGSPTGYERLTGVSISNRI